MTAAVGTQKLSAGTWAIDLIHSEIDDETVAWPPSMWREQRELLSPDRFAHRDHELAAHQAHRRRLARDARAERARPHLGELPDVAGGLQPRGAERDVAEESTAVDHAVTAGLDVHQGLQSHGIVRV